MDVAEPLDVGEDLVGAGARDGAGGAEGIPDQHHARHADAAVDHEVGRPNLDLAGDSVIAGDPPQARQGGVQRLSRVTPDRPHPGIIGFAIGEQIGAHPLADREQRDVGNARAGPLLEIGHRGKGEGGAPDGREIEADRDRMGWAGDLAGDSQHMSQPDIQPVGEHDQSRRHRLPVGEGDLLPLLARGDCDRLGDDSRHGIGNLLPHRGHQRVVHDAVLRDWRPVQDVAESGDPVFRRQRRLAQGLVGDSGAPESRDLLSAGNLLDSEVGRVDGVGIEQNRGDSSPPEHASGNRAGQAAANDRNVGVSGHLAPRRGHPWR